MWVSEERLRRMVNVDAVGVLVWGLPEGRLIDSNDFFLHMFGYSTPEVEAGALTWRDLTPPEYITISEAQMAGFAETGRIGPYEKEYLRKDGSRAWMVFAGAALADSEVVEYCIDVTDRKQTEAEAAQLDREAEAGPRRRRPRNLGVGPGHGRDDRVRPGRRHVRINAGGAARPGGGAADDPP